MLGLWHQSLTENVVGVGGQGHHPPLYRPDLLSYVLKYLRCEPVSVFKCSAGFLRINSRFCSVLQQKLFIYFLGPFYYISNKTTRPQFKDIMSENEFSKKKMVWKRTGRKYTLVVVGGGVVDFNYSVLHIYSWCALFLSCVQWQQYCAMAEFYNIFFSPSNKWKKSSMVYSDDCGVNLTIVLEYKRKQLGM